MYLITWSTVVTHNGTPIPTTVLVVWQNILVKYETLIVFYIRFEYIVARVQVFVTYDHLEVFPSCEMADISWVDISKK